MPAKSHITWTHPSIVNLLSDADPIQDIAGRARAVVFNAIQHGWSGPPFDPFELASLLRIAVVPNGAVMDARIQIGAGDKPIIEFNPTRPQGRIRFSVAHEIAHTLFPDYDDAVRHRCSTDQLRADNWQLEMLCNIAASEFLMPIGSFPDLRQQPLDINVLMDLRRAYDVSTEAVILRAIRLTQVPCAGFAASRREPPQTRAHYLIDYAIPSRSSEDWSLSGLALPNGGTVEECTAIGYTARGDEKWPSVGAVHVECAGIPPFPGSRYPRVVGLVTRPDQTTAASQAIRYLKGDATTPRGTDPRIIAYIVNDKAMAWGGGFARTIQKKWPLVQEGFRGWAMHDRCHFQLGEVYEDTVAPSLLVVAMIAQHGYGPSPTPRLRYAALEQCLRKLAAVAHARSAGVHMPRIGCGEAGGSWDIVSELIEQHLCRQSIPVTVYDLPDAKQARSPMPSLFPKGT